MNKCFSKASETTVTGLPPKAIFQSFNLYLKKTASKKNREVYKPETFCMKGTSM